MRFPSLAILVLVAQTALAPALPITVDPAGAAFTGTWGTEWNTAGNFESWTASQVAGAVVAGGVLSGTTNGTDPKLQVSGFAGGPDLDLGFNDFIETRIQVPATFAGDIQIFYGTTATTGFNAARTITIPSAVIPKDGAFHVYRIDAGPEPWWRSTLRDLRVDPGGTTGVPFAVDYIRVGDLPGDTYLPNTTDQPVTAYELSSKHFRFIWNASRATTNGINATVARGCLRNAEEAWQVYVKELGYREPAESTDPARRNGNKYKVNFLCTNDGFWMSGSPTSFAYLNIDPSGLQVDPPTWVTPHELMHVFQMHNDGGNMPGEWWETHANYGRERWLYHYQNLYPNTSNLDAQAVRDAHLMMASGRNYYLTWLFLLYIDENPDALPDLYDGLVAKIWQETQAGEFAAMALDRLTPVTSLKDIVGYYARRGATLDFSHQAALAAALNSQDPARTARHQFTDLVQRPDAPGWWRVPLEKAPAQGAYAIHELVPAGSGAGRTVTVHLRGLADTARGADWRASFIAVNDAGAERYTPLWSAGNSSITLAANENKLYLAVAGTPDVFYYGGHDESIHPFRSHPSRSRFHYELQVSGATPRERNNGAATGLVQHVNGGGWKAPTATVDATAYVGPNARVLGTAQLRNTARVEDFAVVEGSAQVLNNAIVSGHAWVRGSAVVRDYGRVRDWAIVDGGTVSGNGRVLEHATTGGNVTDSAVAKGSAIAFGGVLNGNAIVDGDYSSDNSLSNGVTCGHLPYVGVPASFTKATPSGLYAAYNFASAHDSRLLDQFGVTDAYAVGAPAWTSADAARKGFITFNGADQYAVLDRSIADSRALTFSAWVKPLGGPANQAVLWLGATPTRRLAFTPDDGTGHAKFSIANGGADQTLTAPAAFATGVWTHVAITLNGTTGTLYVNGAAAAVAPVAIVPDQLLAANTATAAQHNYLARSEANAMPLFRGAIDDVQFHSRALSAAEVAALQPPAAPAGAGTLYVDLRATDPSAGNATWTHNGTLGAFTRIGAPTKVANVLGSGIPGVQFSGNGQAYNGPNSVAALEGGSARTIEVWAWNPALAEEETTVSWGHRGSVRQDMAFNFGSNGSWGAATHWGDDVGWGATPPAAGAWRHLVYTYSGNVTGVFIDGARANTKTLAGPLNTFAGEPINIACQRDTANGTRSLFFSGYLNSVRIHGGVLTDAQIAANASFGPYGSPPNSAPTIAAVPDHAVDLGSPANILFTVSDADTPIAAVAVTASSSNTTLVPAANIVLSGSGTTRTLTITPTAGLTGAATISLLASDGAATATRTVTLTVLSPLESWRRAHFGSPANTGTAADSADPDGDGLTNAQEYSAGTDPASATANPLNITSSGAGVELVFTAGAASGPGFTGLTRTFTVETTTDLANPAAWQPLGGYSNIVGNGQTLAIPVAPGEVRRFYRLKISLQ